jgi:membrane dipeptidase
VTLLRRTCDVADGGGNHEPIRAQPPQMHRDLPRSLSITRRRRPAGTIASMAPLDLDAARDLVASTLVWDNHGCMPVGAPYGIAFLPQLRRYRDSGVNVASINIGFGEMGVEEHLATIAAMRRWIRAHAADYLLVTTPADVDHARATGRLGICFDIEGANAIGEHLPLIALYHDLGVRWMALAYNRNNRVGGGCQDDDTGLTPFGRDVIAEMERVGMVVCLSHTGHRTARDVLAIATRPVIFSHSNASALVAHPRNIPDDLIRACAATDGVVGINGIGLFLRPTGTDLARAMADHIDHVVQLVGPRHAGLAIDTTFDTAELEAYVANNPATFPPELGYDAAIPMGVPEDLVAIVAWLQAKGYTRDDLAAILGGNTLRIAHQGWHPIAAHP